ncbi:hypothetical protein [Streptomyces sp. NBC_01217]|uniref:hypothetical protein n=1 Tax=Streptomyces sp. NBC_01217 TaxID=2903779 RepID=UPI002E149B56|nr:hypothetical protein OG507_24050 [Streptomyces sp. NBC_01217]
MLLRTATAAVSTLSILVFGASPTAHAINTAEQALPNAPVNASESGFAPERNHHPSRLLPCTTGEAM